MGQRLTQRIFECTECGKIPDDGEHIWEMGANELWCQECCDREEPEDDNELES